jgi:hypothetical protein
MTQLAVVAQKVGDMKMTSPQLSASRDMPADGQIFIVQGWRDPRRRHLGDAHRPATSSGVAETPGASARRRDCRGRRGATRAGLGPTKTRGAAICMPIATSCSPSWHRSKHAGAGHDRRPRLCVGGPTVMELEGLYAQLE